MREKRAAIELSMSTIVVVVLSLTLLVFGFIFVRSLMCKGIGLTDETGKLAEKEILKLFGESSEEIACLGSGSQAVPIFPGEDNIIWCGIKPKETSSYNIKLTGISGELGEKNVEKWFIGNKEWSGKVAPSNNPKTQKILRLRVPDDAPEKTLTLQVEISRDGEVIGTQDLDFKITRVGVIKAAMC